MNGARRGTIHSVGTTQKRHTQKYSLVIACAAFSVFALFALINACTPKDSSKKQAQSSRYGTPEYVIELPPGYEDLKVIPESQKEPLTQPPANPESLSGSQPGAPGAGASVARLARLEGTVPSGAPVLIIVIDDVGYNNGELKPFLELPFPITFAVLPQLPHSADSALSIQKAGKEMILHQPMEALGGNDPGPHAVYLSMDEATIAKTVAENIDSFPYQPKGMNNHMGSAVTRDRNAMTPVLKLVKERGMYYLDSLTTPGTAISELCRELGTPYMERNVFLDNKSDRESILAAIEEGKRIARKRGAAVMIGHVWSTNLAATLMEIYPELVEQGYSLSTISQYMQLQAEENSGHADSWN